MKTVTAREATQDFPELLTRIERGEEVLITRDGRPVARITPCGEASQTPKNREAAIQRAVALMREGLPWPTDFRMPTRDEMHER